MRIRFGQQVAALAMLATCCGSLTATAGPIRGVAPLTQGRDVSAVDPVTGLLRPLELSIEPEFAGGEADPALIAGDQRNGLDAGLCRPGTGCVTCSEPASDPGQLVVLAGLMFLVWRRTRQQPRA